MRSRRAPTSREATPQISDSSPRRTTAIYPRQSAMRGFVGYGRADATQAARRSGTTGVVSRHARVKLATRRCSSAAVAASSCAWLLTSAT